MQYLIDARYVLYHKLVSVILCTIIQLTPQRHSLYCQTTYPSTSFSVLSDNLPLNVILCTVRQFTPQRHSLHYQTTYPSTSFSALSDNLPQRHSLHYQTTYHNATLFRGGQRDGEIVCSVRLVRVFFSTILCSLKMSPTLSIDSFRRPVCFIKQTYVACINRPLKNGKVRFLTSVDRKTKQMTVPSIQVFG